MFRSIRFISRLALLAFSVPAWAQDEVDVEPAAEPGEAELAEAQNSQDAAQQALGAVGGFVGVTAVTTKGRIAAAGADIGIAAASKLCSNQFGRAARICTTADIYNSILNGKLGKKPVPPAWVFAPAGGQAPGAIPDVGGNCGGYTYDTGHFKWTGTSFQWNGTSNLAPAGDGAAPTPIFEGRLPCASMMHVSCCR